jgi:hypothetical protein
LEDDEAVSRTLKSKIAFLFGILNANMNCENLQLPAKQLNNPSY